MQGQRTVVYDNSEINQQRRYVGKESNNETAFRNCNYATSNFQLYPRKKFIP